MPAAASATRCVIVSSASPFVWPMRPTGPRLIQPVAYTPGSGEPCSSSTRPSALGMTAATSSNGTPGRGELA